MAGYSTFESQWSGTDCMCPSKQGYGTQYGLYSGVAGHSVHESDEYGKLFGQGGWFQKTFRPQSYATYMQSAEGISFQQPATIEVDGVETAVASDSGGGGNIFTRLFGTKASRQASRQERALARVAGTFVNDPSGNANVKYRLNADGSATEYRRDANGEWRSGRVAGAGSNTASGVLRAAKGYRAGQIAQGIGSGLSALPGILSQFGIGLPGAAGAGAVPGDLPPDTGVMEQPSRPFPWVWVGVGTLAVVVLIASTRKRAPAPAPAAPAPRRRRTR